MYLFFDTETTGLPKRYDAPVTDLENWPRVIQLAWAYYDRDEKLIACDKHLIKPNGWVIPTVEQLKANGSKDPHFFERNNLSTERCEKEGAPMEEVLPYFLNALEDCWYLVAHNVSFDSKVLGAEFIRAGIECANRPQHFCTKEASTNYCQIPGPYGFKWPKLEELHRHLFNADFDGAHDALNDVMACAKCFFELKRIGVIKQALVIAQ